MLGSLRLDDLETKTASSLPKLVRGPQLGMLQETLDVTWSFSTYLDKSQWFRHGEILQDCPR